MKESLQIQYLPKLEDPLFIAGFEGWGNALDISRGMADYLIRKLKAKRFAEINPDLFYRFDEHRPVVDIQDGSLKDLTPPGGRLYAVQGRQAGRDMVILKAIEPNLAWFQFVDTILSLCQKMGVRTIISLGSMYDNVLHTDTVISALASDQGLLSKLQSRNMAAVNYKGPSAIHSTIHSQAKKQGFQSVSLWCHCPYYLQGTTHFGLLARLGSVLSSWGGFQLDTEELDLTWQELSRQIEGIIEKNPELQGMIQDLQKAKVKQSWDSTKKHKKIIHLEDFLKPK
jgi:proteasome assembly chaperone (PAC2) family protein